MERGWGDHIKGMKRGGVTIWEGWRGGGCVFCDFLEVELCGSMFLVQP